LAQSLIAILVDGSSRKDSQLQEHFVMLHLLNFPSHPVTTVAPVVPERPIADEQAAPVVDVPEFH
jgi:hypothetical protein